LLSSAPRGAIKIDTGFVLRDTLSYTTSPCQAQLKPKHRSLKCTNLTMMKRIGNRMNTQKT
jgi:hypothetical protein